MNYYVYILYSQTKDRYYIGYSHDPQERLTEHNMGATPSTRPGRPWIMAYTEVACDKSAAIKREQEIKRMKSKKYIKRLISRRVGPVPLLRNVDPRKSNSAIGGKDFRD